MKIANPYLNFPGNAEEAFNFYKSVFGGEFSMLMRMKDAAGMPIPEGQDNKIMHIALPLGNGQVLMASDNCNEQTFKEGNNVYVSLHADSVEEGQTLYDALVAGGTAQHSFEKQFWGSWHGNLRDKFGIHWMVNYDAPAEN